MKINVVKTSVYAGAISIQAETTAEETTLQTLGAKMGSISNWKTTPSASVPGVSKYSILLEPTKEKKK